MVTTLKHSHSTNSKNFKEKKEQKSDTQVILIGVVCVKSERYDQFSCTCVRPRVAQQRKRVSLFFFVDICVYLLYCDYWMICDNWYDLLFFSCLVLSFTVKLLQDHAHWYVSTVHENVRGWVKMGWLSNFRCWSKISI